MTKVVLEKAEVLSIRDHSAWDEAMIQQRIASDPSILGFGPLLLRDKERIQPHKGRLDLLLQSGDGNTWYEVEVQLGPTDESHIIRAIEYWDVERKRYPDIQHTAVLIAEEITGRFFNVIGLFNQAIPIIALKMSALKVGDRTALLFTKVLDYERKGTEASEDAFQPVDRTAWEEYAPITMKLADKVLAIVKEFDSTAEFKFNKNYIGTTSNGRRVSSLMLTPQKRALKLAVNLDETPDNDKLCQDAGMPAKYDAYWWGYQFDLVPEEFERLRPFLRNFIGQLYSARS